MNEGSSNESDKDILTRRVSYYVEENEKLLNLLITNCEPILSEIVKQVDHFNTYNKIKRVVDKLKFPIEELSI